MSKNPLPLSLATAGLAALLATALPVQATDASETIEVRGGNNTSRQFRLDESRVVQFPGKNSESNIQLRSASQAERKRLNTQKSLGAGTPVDNVTTAEGDTVSPVLTDSAGNPWALPGGLIVTLKEGASESEARARLEAAGLTPERRISERVWVVQSPAGLASIEQANALNAKGIFADVSPNWWTPRARK
ncbi:MAG: hypothetical protein Q4A16_08775 [Lautropia sp.]|nr:hypothetical protein [Lautropia sp.]